MNVVWFSLGAAAWIGCGVIARGLLLGDFTRRFPYMNHTVEARLGNVTGPLGIAAALLTGCRFKDFRLHHLPVEERRRIFLKEYECLGAEYFDRKHA